MFYNLLTQCGDVLFLLEIYLHRRYNKSEGHVNSKLDSWKRSIWSTMPNMHFRQRYKQT